MNLTGRHVSVVAVLVTASLVTAACSSTPVTVTNPAAPRPLASGSWPYSNGDLADTRDAGGSTGSSRPGRSTSRDPRQQASARTVPGPQIRSPGGGAGA